MSTERQDLLLEEPGDVGLRIPDSGQDPRGPLSKQEVFFLALTSHKGGRGVIAH